MKTFFFFFGEHLRFVSLVLGLGLEHSCPWPRECLSSERLSLALASDFFCVLGLGLEPCVLDSTSGKSYRTRNVLSVIGKTCPTLQNTLGWHFFVVNLLQSLQMLPFFRKTLDFLPYLTITFDKLKTSPSKNKSFKIAELLDLLKSQCKFYSMFKN